jgi:hypothetical protein
MPKETDKPNIFRRFGRFLKHHWKTFVPLILFGVIASICAVLLESYLHHGDAARELPWAGAIGVKVLDHLGLGLIAAGILGIGIELQHMHKYFQKLIQSTMIDRAFIKQLSEPEKEKLQEQALAAFFGVDELSQERGFYKFYREKIRKHIGGPFRTDTTFETKIERTENEDFFKVTDSISFKCKKGGKTILPEIEWTTEKDESERVLQLEITAKKPAQGSEPDSYSFDVANNSYPPPLEPYTSGRGCKLSLAQYADCDGLEVTLKVVYVVSRERAFSWTMPYLSDGFSGEIQFPDDLQIFVDRFGIDESAVSKDTGICKISHKKWLLPEDGFSFSFQQKPPAPAVSESPIAATQEPGPTS